MTIKLQDNVLLFDWNISMNLVEPIDLPVMRNQPGKSSGIKIIEGKHIYLNMKTDCL